MEKIDKTILVWDTGDFTFVAKYFSQYFKKVYYYSPWESAFPYYGPKNIGTGIEGVERINEPLMQQEDVDINYFADIYFMDFCNYLKSAGKQCFGSGDMEMLERNRHTFYDLLTEAGLPVAPTVFIKGFDKLLKYLKGKKNLWVKLSEYRGSGETFQWIDDNFNEFFSNEWKRQLGPGIYDEEVEFLVQEPIDTELEWGIDTNLVDSEFPDMIYLGFEIKACSMYTKYESIKNLPDSWQELLSTFSKAIKKYHYTGPFSMEVRVGKDGKQYFIDPTVRLAYPATAITMYMSSNYGQMIVDALNGSKTNLKSENKYGAEIIVRGSICNNWIPAYFDKKNEDKIFLTNNMVRENITWRIPGEQLYCDSGKYCSVTAASDKLETAIKEAQETLDDIKSKGIDSVNDMFEHSKTVRQQLEKLYNYSF